MKLDSRSINVAFAKFQFRNSNRQRIDLYRILYFLLRNGIGAYDALKELHKRALKKGKDHPQVIMYGDWIAQMDNGRDFSDALADWVPGEERALISAGAKAGRLETIFPRVIEAVKFSSDISAALLAATLYPTVLFIAALGIVFLFGIKIIPTFAQISDPKSWTGIAKSLHILSGLVTQYWWVIVVVFPVIFVTYRYSLSNFLGKLRVKFDRYPPYSYYRIRLGSGFLISLAVLVETGTNIERALVMLRQSGDKWLRERLDPVIAYSRSGVGLGEALERSGHEFPDRSIIDSIVIFSQRAELDKALQITAKEWMENGMRTINAQAATLKTAAFLLVVAVVAWLVLGLFAIQQEIAQTIQQGAR